MSHTIKTNKQYEKEQKKGKRAYVKRKIEEEEAEEEIKFVVSYEYAPFKHKWESFGTCK